MAFEEIEILTASKTASHTGVSVGLVKIRNGKALLKINFRPHVFEEMGFAESDHFVPMLGTGEDYGMIRLQKNKGGKVRAKLREASHGARYFCVNLGQRPEFVDRAEKAVPCQWEKIDLATIEIVLPAWVDETNPSKPKRIAAEPPTVAAGRREAERMRAEAQAAVRRREESELRQVQSEMRKVVADALKDVPEFHPKLGLTVAEADVLGVLASRHGKLVSRDSLMTLIYGANADELPDDKIIDVWISKIRPKLPISVSIETVHGQGWRLKGDVKQLYAVVAA
ncbi:helix-turn-helix domain-containing protein [Ensifer sp. LCM 4579]|uniref:helix-turn-helix domain-containing protein n=1 Tax=Ensifer sp. LCM 4579 TaxID=1848292 RepID=UPI0008D9825B|nr:helix-turn-helix domain-containing protein [Ensifer sp. LCM 4579]OHV85936.1 hypothetical protein LCM4579_00815 [Ensifer sp. LCM 4579]